MRPWGEGWETHPAAAAAGSDGGCIPGGVCVGVGMGGSRGVDGQHKLTASPFGAGGNSLCAFLGWAGGSACLWVGF